VRIGQAQSILDGETGARRQMRRGRMAASPIRIGGAGAPSPGCGTSKAFHGAVGDPG